MNYQDYGFQTKDAVSSAAGLIGGFAGSWAGYNTAKSNLRTAKANAAELLETTRYNADIMRGEQQRHEAENLARIAGAGLTSASFSDVLRDDLMQSEAAIKQMTTQAIKDSSNMVAAAQKARRKAKTGMLVQTLLGGASTALAPFTGGLSLIGGGALSTAANQAGY